MSFKIIVDSCCDLTPAQLRDGCFVSVPLTIHVGSHVVVDDPCFDRGALLHAMHHCPTAPHTSCPSPAQYLDAFDCGAEDIYVVTLSALLSGSHNAAAQARNLWLEEHPEANVHIFNSCSASAGEVLVALKIQELAQSGMDFTTVVAQVSRYIEEMDTMFVLENLDNLRKNGRLSRMQSAHQAAAGLHSRGGDLQAGPGHVGEAGSGQGGLHHGGRSQPRGQAAGHRPLQLPGPCLLPAGAGTEAVPVLRHPDQRDRRHLHGVRQRRRRGGRVLRVFPAARRVFPSGRLFFAVFCGIVAKIFCWKEAVP